MIKHENMVSITTGISGDESGVEELEQSVKVNLLSQVNLLVNCLTIHTNFVN